MRQPISLAVGLGLVLCWVLSCSRNVQDSEEVTALRQEVKSLKAELEHRKAETNTRAIPSTPEQAEFLRTSRRIVSAMGTGVSCQDFGQRLIEVNASAEEVLSVLADNALKAKISDFVLALHDAHSLWKYQISSGRDTLKIQMDSGRYGYPIGFPAVLGDRWNTRFPQLVEKYGLHKDKQYESSIIDYGGKPEMFFDPALQCIFAYAVKTFREVEQTSPRGESPR